MVMTREVLPHCFLRVVGQPKDDKVNIIEYKLINCMYEEVFFHLRDLQDLILGKKKKAFITLYWWQWWRGPTHGKYFN